MACFKHRLPSNVPGRFYVDDMCLDHDLCSCIAPKNFRRDHEQANFYVFKQPETPEELAQCLDAVEGCPVCAIGCDGDRHDWSTPIEAMTGAIASDLRIPSQPNEPENA